MCRQHLPIAETQHKPRLEEDISDMGLKTGKCCMRAGCGAIRSCINKNTDFTETMSLLRSRRTTAQRLKSTQHRKTTMGLKQAPQTSPVNSVFKRSRNQKQWLHEKNVGPPTEKGKPYGSPNSSPSGWETWIQESTQHRKTTGLKKAPCTSPVN